MDVQTLQSYRDQLQQLDATACGFAHEFTDGPTPNFCPKAFRDKKLGCAHSTVPNATICGVIEGMRQAGLLNETTSEIYLAHISATSQPLLRLDNKAASDGMYEDGSPQSYKDGQQVHINAKDRVRCELLAIINGQLHS